LKHPARVAGAAISPDGKVAITTSSIVQRRPNGVGGTGAVFRWDGASGADLGRLVEIPELIRSATFVRGGQAVLIVSAETIGASIKLRLVDAVSGKAIGEPRKPGEWPVPSPSVPTAGAS
jgi:hypothetical protein